MRQVEHPRLDPLVSRRAIGQSVARRRNGRRHFQRHRLAFGGRHGRGVAHFRRMRRTSGHGLRGSVRDAPHLPRRQRRIPAQQNAVPSARHSRVVHGYRHRPQQLLDHGAGQDRPDPEQPSGRPSRCLRGSGRHHQIQSAEEGSLAQTRIHRGQPRSRERHHARGEAPDWFAPAPGRQGAPLSGALQ